MRIAKYFFLLILLFGFALLVFVFTQNGNFEIQKSKIIKNINQKTVYNYIEDFKNWKEFITDFNNSNHKKNQFYDKNKKYTLIQKFKYDSLHYNYTYNKNNSKLRILFEKQNKSTKITWNFKGNYTYKEKFLAFFYGNNDKNLKIKVNNYLTNINNNLQKEHFYFKIKYNQIIQKQEQSVTFKTINCSIANQDKEVAKNLKLINNTLDSLKIKSLNAPFIIYNWKDLKTQNTQFKICIEIPKFSDTLFAKYQTFQLKTLSYQCVNYEGNNKYLPHFWNNYENELKKRNKIFIKNQGVIELLDKNNLKITKKHQYKTNFLIPVNNIFK